MPDFLQRFFNPQPSAVTYRPDADFWYEPAGGPSSSGILVTQDAALRISAFFACLRVIGETTLSAPLKVYRRLPNGDRVEAPEHPAWPIVHGDDPNDEQTSPEWRETHVVHTAMRGTSYSEIIAGARGPLTHVQYLVPDRVRLERLPSGRVRYQVRDEETGREREVSKDKMFRFPGLSSNGLTGISVLEHARESLGISLSLQQYAGRSFNNGVRTSGVLEMPTSLRDREKVEQLRRQWQETYGGSANAGKTIILEDGMTYKQVSMSNEDAQMLASEQWQVNDVARWFRMPLIMIQEQEKSTSWGTGVEHQQIGFVVFTMLPWFVRHEKRINKQMITPVNIARGARPDEYFCEYAIEGLLRGDVKSRFEAYQIAAGGQAPWMNRNEVRRRENLNRGPDELDDYLQPANMGVAGQTPAPVSPPAGQRALAAGVDPRLRTYAQVLAGQIARKESVAIERLARKHADDGSGWERELGDFYGELAEDICERCQVGASASAEYAARWRERVLREGASAASGWEESKVGELMDLMLDGSEEEAA